MENMPHVIPPNNSFMRFWWSFKRKFKYDSRFSIKVKFSTIITALLLILLIPIFKGVNPNVSFDKLNTPKNVGDYNVALTSRAYNPNKDLLVMQYKVSSQGSITALPLMKFKVKAYSGTEKLGLKVYRTDDDQYTVIVNGLASGYKALKTNVSYLSPNATTQTDNDFYVGESGITNNSLQEMQPRDYTIQAVTQEISKNENSIKASQDKISQIKTQISQNEDNIDTYKSTEDYKINRDKAEVNQKIQDLQNQNQQNQKQIDSLNNSISRNKDRNTLLNKELSDIKHGLFDFGTRVISQNE